MSQYNSVSQMPSHGNASEARVANAREGFQRGGMGNGSGLSGMAGRGNGDGSMRADARARAGDFIGNRGNDTCSFPPPAPQRVYCSPAVFTDLFGRKYIPISQAYGNSVPAQAYY